MSISYNGGMIVGCLARDISKDITGDDECDWFEENGLEIMFPHYDCDIEESTVGYLIADVPVSKIDELVVRVKEAAKQFKDLTGQEAQLIGALDIY
jgi:hypothetical protein